MDKSAENGLKSIGNIMRVQRNPPENREQLQKFSKALAIMLKYALLRRPTIFSTHEILYLWEGFRHVFATSVRFCSNFKLSSLGREQTMNDYSCTTEHVP